MEGNLSPITFKSDCNQSRKVMIIKTIKSSLIEKADQISILKFKSVLLLKNSQKLISVQLLEVKWVKWGVENWLPGPDLCGLMFLRKHYSCLWLKLSYENNYPGSGPSSLVGIRQSWQILIAATNQNDTFKITNVSSLFFCRPAYTTSSPVCAGMTMLNGSSVLECSMGG